MKYLIFLSLVLLSCSTTKIQTHKYRSNFSSEEKKMMTSAREVIINSKYGTLITIDENGQPRSRIMDAMFPDEKFEVWLATNPKSRKVDQIKNNPKVTMYYWYEDQNAYVSLMGNAKLIDDDEIKLIKWKTDWTKFYKNKNDDVLLIHFVPDVLEIINVSKGYDGDKESWSPHKINLRK